MRKKLFKIMEEKQGAALIYALCVMAVFTFICFALLFVTAQVGTMTTTDRRREVYYQQALTMSDVIEEELANTGSQMRIKVDDYLPVVNKPSDFTKRKPRTFVAKGNNGNPTMSIRLQNDEYMMQESSTWALDAVAYQSIDITVSAYDSSDAMASVTTRYACYQKCGDMIYNITYTDKDGQITAYTQLVEPGGDGASFMDRDNNPIELTWNGKKITLGDAKQWMGAQQHGSDGSSLLVTRSRVVNPGSGAVPGEKYYEKIERR